MVFGISTNPLATNKKFAESLGLEFALLSDEDGAVAKKFGVLNASNVLSARTLARRTTFVIDKGGKIVHVKSGIGAFVPDSAANACSML